MYIEADLVWLFVDESTEENFHWRHFIYLFVISFFFFFKFASTHDDE